MFSEKPSRPFREILRIALSRFGSANIRLCFFVCYKISPPRRCICLCLLVFPLILKVLRRFSQNPFVGFYANTSGSLAIWFCWYMSSFFTYALKQRRTMLSATSVTLQAWWVYFIAYMKNELRYQQNQIATTTLRSLCKNRRRGLAKNASELLKSKEIRANTNRCTDEVILSHPKKNKPIYPKNQTSTVLLKFICRNGREGFSKNIQKLFLTKGNK